MKRAALVVLLVTSVLAPVAVSASERTQPLCSVCDADFERAAEENGVEATVVESTVEVELAEDGTARWVVRNRLDDESTADRLRDDDGLLDEIVGKALDRGRPDRDHVSDVSARVVGDAVTVEFVHDSFADRDPGGVLVVEYFHTGGDRSSYGLDADRFAVTAPEGYAVVNEPATGEVEDGHVTWVNRGTERGHADDYVSDTYAAFARDEGAVTDAALRLAFARRALPAVVDNLAMLAPAGLALVGGLAAFRNVVRAGLGPRRPDRAAAGVFGVGLLAVVHPVYAGTVPLVNDTIPALAAAGIVYVLVAVTTLALGRTREAIPWWVLLAPALGVFALSGVGTPVADLGYPAGRRIASKDVLLAVPVATAFPLGYAVAAGNARERRAAAAATLFAVAAITLEYVSFAQEPIAGGLAAILSLALAVFGLGFSFPLFLLGASLARASNAAP